MPVHHQFEARFGAHLHEGGASFRLWAPDARSVELCREGAAPVPMAIGDGGIATVDVAAARAGDRYRYRIDGGLEVPDPASRFQPDGVHGPSELIDPNSYRWEIGRWAGRPWREAVIYELHLGTFTEKGSALAAIDKLDALVELGVTAVELMPVAAAPGMRGWGYDGVQIYAPHRAYGRPDDLKRLIDEAHARGLMVLLDVVYNHFGPDGNYIGTHASSMFTDADTPWGAAIAVDGPHRDPVRRFFIDNALYWLIEYRFDGLRLDAVDRITEDSEPSFLVQLAAEVNERIRDRQVHLVLENDRNQATLLDGPGRGGYRAQWNDDIHHALHSLITGEADGYYADYQPPLEHLGRCLAEGFAYQGEVSEYRGGRRRGEDSTGLSPTSFVAFLQNHDQIGNRALGDRIDRIARDPAALEAAQAIALLSPQIPLVFQGEEWMASTPFLFFCDHLTDELRVAVREGRRREFARFLGFAGALEQIPDPSLESTFEDSVLDWSERDRDPHRRALARTAELLKIRAAEITPLLGEIESGSYRIDRSSGGHHLEVRWPVAGGARVLAMDLNTGEAELARRPRDNERIIAATGGAAADRLPPWALLVSIKENER